MRRITGYRYSAVPDELRAMHGKRLQLANGTMSAEVKVGALETHVRNSKVRAMLVFAAHQIMGTWGAAFTAATGVFFFFTILRPVNSHWFGPHQASTVLTELPYFPAQIASSLWWGWYLSQRLRHRTMFWVWIAPLGLLTYAFLMLPPILLSPLPTAASAAGQSRWWHYFGGGCSLGDHDPCFDQLVLTMPFYASTAYSVGALAARKSWPFGRKHRHK